MLLALWRNIRSAGHDTESLVSDIKIGKQLGNAFLPELIAESVLQAGLVGLNGGVELLGFLLRLHVLLDLARRLDLFRPTVTFGFLLLG